MIAAMDIICYSHLRWNFVFQRPQHLLTRMADHFRVVYIEEPIFDTDKDYLDSRQDDDKVWVLVPHLPAGLNQEEVVSRENILLKEFLEQFGLQQFIAWYYTPMALDLNPSFTPSLTVYDCMDELSAFKNAPAILKERERELLKRRTLFLPAVTAFTKQKKIATQMFMSFPAVLTQAF